MSMLPTPAQLRDQRRAFIQTPDDPFFFLARAREARGLPWDSLLRYGAEDSEKERGCPYGWSGARPQGIGTIWEHGNRARFAREHPELI